MEPPFQCLTNSGNQERVTRWTAPLMQRRPEGGAGRATLKPDEGDSLPTFPSNQSYGRPDRGRGPIACKRHQHKVWLLLGEQRLRATLCWVGPRVWWEKRPASLGHGFSRASPTLGSRDSSLQQSPPSLLPSQLHVSLRGWSFGSLSSICGSPPLPYPCLGLSYSTQYLWWQEKRALSLFPVSPKCLL